MLENTLKTYFGYRSFRPGQREIIEKILSGRDVLAILPTGGGKSLCYQLPAIELNGLSLVISPLISLMKDQVDQAREMGIKASYLNSTLDEDEVLKTYKDIEEEKINLLYLAPERLDSRYFVDLIKSKYITFIAIDEAHCISQWGHDFRPSYRKIRNFIENLNKRQIVDKILINFSKNLINSPESFMSTNVIKAYEGWHKAINLI